jgi:hypothetical protein
MSSVSLNTLKTGDLYKALDNALKNKDSSLEVKGGRYVHLKTASDQEITTSVRKIRDHIKSLAKEATPQDKKILQDCLRLNGRIDMELDKKVKGVGAKIKLAFHHISKPFAKPHRVQQAAAFKELSGQAVNIKSELSKLKAGASDKDVVKAFAEGLSKEDKTLNEDVFAAFAELSVKYPKQALTLLQHEGMKIVPKSIMQELAVFVPKAQAEIDKKEKEVIVEPEMDLKQEVIVEPKPERLVNVEPKRERLVNVKPKLGPKVVNKPIDKPIGKPIDQPIDQPIGNTKETEKDEIVKPKEKTLYESTVDFFSDYFAGTPVDKIKKEIESEGRKVTTGNLSFLLSATVSTNEAELIKILDQIKPNIETLKVKLGITNDNKFKMDNLIDWRKNPTELGKSFMDTLLLPKAEFAKYDFVVEDKALAKIIPPAKLTEDEKPLAQLFLGKVEGNLANFDRALQTFFTNHHNELKHNVEKDVKGKLTELKDKLPLTIGSENETVEFLKVLFGVSEHKFTADQLIQTYDNKNMITLPKELKASQQIQPLVSKYMKGDLDEFSSLLKAGDPDQVVTNLRKLQGHLTNWQLTLRQIDLKAMTKVQRQELAAALTKSNFNVNLLGLIDGPGDTVIVDIKAVQRSEAELVKEAKAAIWSTYHKHFTESKDLEGVLQTLIKGATTSEQLKHIEVNLEKNFKLLEQSLKGRKIDADALEKQPAKSRQVLVALMSPDFKAGDIGFNYRSSTVEGKACAVVNTIQLRGIDFDDVYRTNFAKHFGTNQSQKAAFTVIFDEFVLSHRSEITQDSIDRAITQMPWGNQRYVPSSEEQVNQQFLAALFGTKDQLLNTQENAPLLKTWFINNNQGVPVITLPKVLSSASAMKVEKDAIKKAYLTCMTEDDGVFRALTEGATTLDLLKARKATVVKNFQDLASSRIKAYGIFGGDVIKINSSILMSDDQDVRDEFLKAMTEKSFSPWNITFGKSQTIRGVEYSTITGYSLSSAAAAKKAQEAQALEQRRKNQYMNELDQVCQQVFFFDATDIDVEGIEDEPLAFANMFQLAKLPKLESLSADALEAILERVKSNMKALCQLPNIGQGGPFSRTIKRLDADAVPMHQLLKVLTDPRPLNEGSPIRIVSSQNNWTSIDLNSINSRYNAALPYIIGDDSNNQR